MRTNNLFIKTLKYAICALTVYLSLSYMGKGAMQNNDMLTITLFAVTIVMILDIICGLTEKKKL